MKPKFKSNSPTQKQIRSTYQYSNQFEARESFQYKSRKIHFYSPLSFMKDNYLVYLNVRL